MYISLSPPSHFLATPGQPPIPWTRWLDSFTTFLEAAGLDAASDARKRALLIHCLGQEGQRIFHALPNNGSTYDTATTASATHFKPRESILPHRLNFRRRSQLPGETVVVFVQSLRELAAKCNFGALTDEFIRDHLIEKTLSARVRERLLLEPDSLTLDRAVELAVQVEGALRDAGRLASSSLLDSKVQYVKKASKAASLVSKQVICFNCGTPGHKAKDSICRALKSKCRSCQKLGHFSQCCRSKSVKSLVSDISDESAHVVFNVSTATGELQTSEVTLDGVTLPLVIDSGARCSLLNEAT